MPSETPVITETPYSFKFDRKRDTWACSKHGDVEDTGWVPCWSCGGAGGQDEHECDAVNYAPGERWDTCDECKGEGGWMVCGQCNANNPDVEW